MNSHLNWSVVGGNVDPEALAKAQEEERAQYSQETDTNARVVYQLRYPSFLFSFSQVLYIHFIYTLYTLYIHFIYTLYPLYIHFISTLYTFT